MYADIITIGDEILIGQILNTNAGFLGEELTRLGFSVRRILAIPDQEESILRTLDESLEHTDFLIITGGLGPTSDDITKQTLNTYFHGNLIIHEPSLRRIRAIFKMRGFSLTERNRKQAEIPDVCEPLPNKLGTAPGMLFNRDSKLIASLPGVPFEMKALWENELVPRIKEHYKLPVKLQKTVLTIGLSESYTADKLRSWEEALDPTYKIAYLPSPGLLRIRISVSSDSSGKTLQEALEEKIGELIHFLGEKYVFGLDEDTIQEVVGGLLKSNRLTLAIAESCTGGNIARLITSVAGASAYFRGSVTAYENEIKSKFLGVDPDDIATYGAVSRQVVEKMAKSIRKEMSSDFSVATSGIAGPDGGTPDKPIGTTWIAIASPKKVFAVRFLFGDNRERNITRASLTALNMLRIATLEYLENSR
jgi:nicotinamide-nucleotide amidase